MGNLTVKGAVSQGPALLTGRASQPAAGLGPPASPPKPKLLDQVRQAIRARHYSRRTEELYVMWIKRFIFFHGKRYPAEMGERKSTLF